MDSFHTVVENILDFDIVKPHKLCGRFK